MFSEEMGSALRGVAEAANHRPRQCDDPKLLSTTIRALCLISLRVSPTLLLSSSPHSTEVLI